MPRRVEGSISPLMRRSTSHNVLFSDDQKQITNPVAFNITLGDLDKVNSVRTGNITESNQEYQTARTGHNSPQRVFLKGYSTHVKLPNLRVVKRIKRRTKPTDDQNITKIRKIVLPRKKQQQQTAQDGQLVPDSNRTGLAHGEHMGDDPEEENAMSKIV